MEWSNWIVLRASWIKHFMYEVSISFSRPTKPTQRQLAVTVEKDEQQILILRR